MSANRQRQVIYEQRKKVLKGEALGDDVEEMLEEMVEGMVPEYVDEKTPSGVKRDLQGLDERIFHHFTLKLNLAGMGCERGHDEASCPQAILERITGGQDAPPEQGDGIRETADGLPDEGDHAPVH